MKKILKIWFLIEYRSKKLNSANALTNEVITRLILWNLKFNALWRILQS